MNFLALFVGLAIERALTTLFHLREFRWLDPLFDIILTNKRLTQPNLVVAAVAVFVALLVIPVVLVETVFSDRLAYIPQFVFAVIVLLFCLGPRDLGKEVTDYCEALEKGDENEARDIARELLEREPESDSSAWDIEAAIYAQANNRIFGVVFWFVVLGPGGAWLFRVLDLLRHRAAEQALPGETVDAASLSSPIIQAVLLFHWLIGWIPGRLLAVGYVLAGSYDGAAAAWKSFRSTEALSLATETGALLGTVGKGAAAWARPEGSATGRVANARELVFRTLWMIWCPVLALLTLYDLMA